MLARSFRISKKDLNRLYHKGKKVREGNLLLRLLHNHTEHPRFAIIISKKVAPKAVDRTRLKRKTAVILQDKLAKEKLGNFDLSIAYQKFPAENEIISQLEKALTHLKEN